MRSVQDQVAELQRRLKLYQSWKVFKPGDVVVQIEGLELWKGPTKTMPGVVVEVLDAPIYNTANDRYAGTRYFAEPLDIVVAVLAPPERPGASECMCFYYVNSSRLRMYKSGADDTAEPGDA